MYKLIECPRDAMQGLHDFISTDLKVEYLNTLLKVGFDTLDFGSFVSPKAIPQMRDTAEVVERIDWQHSSTKLLAIVANRRGAEDAISFPQVRYLGFPLSISETFQQRNTNQSIAQALDNTRYMADLCREHERELVVYISMGFGNPYGDPYNAGLVSEFTQKLRDMGVGIVSLADTIGSSNPELIEEIFSEVIPAFPDLEIGAHLHSTPDTAVSKIKAALNAGCQRFDGALKGYGGCPMARDDLTGNLATETLVAVMGLQGVPLGLDMDMFDEALALSNQVFSQVN